MSRLHIASLAPIPISKSWLVGPSLSDGGANKPLSAPHGVPITHLHLKLCEFILIVFYVWNIYLYAVV